ncbi:MAG: cytochrome c oxidase subunit II [Rhodospirillaceae bacterium]
MPGSISRFVARRSGATLGAVAGGIAALSLGVAPAFAEGIPQPWQLGFQEANSPVMHDIVSLHDFITWIMAFVCLFVLGLLIYVAVRYNHKANPTPSKVTHNVKIEVIWTLVPVLILIAIAVPSFRLLYFMDRTQDAEMTLKVIGYQWYWGYEYPDHKDIVFDSYMLREDEPGGLSPRLLAVDNRVVLPTETNIRVLITANDVIHSWALPALGLKTDAVPGRINETWVRIEKPGLYYGQCSELCGVEHGFMPIAIEAVSREEFDGWVETAAEEFGDPDADAIKLADKPIRPIQTAASN